MKKTILLLMLVSLLTACENKMSLRVAQSSRMTGLEMAPAGSKQPAQFSTIVNYALLAGTTTANNLPENYPIEVRLELIKTEMGGHQFPLQYKATSGVTISKDGRSATWKTIAIEKRGPPVIEISVVGDIDHIETLSVTCGARLPVLIETKWKVLPKSDEWEIELPHEGVSRSTNITAFVECSKVKQTQSADK